MSPRHVRALRGTAAACVATLVAATAHTLAGGGAPSLALVVAIAVLASPVGVLLAGRRLATWRVAASVVVSQALFHVAFALTADADPTMLHGHHVAHLGGDLSAVVLPAPPMMLAHLVAAAATVLALTRGERMLRALGRGIRSLFAPVVAVVPPAAQPRQVALPARRVRVRARTVLSDLSRRGPPVFV